MKKIIITAVFCFMTVVACSKSNKDSAPIVQNKTNKAQSQVDRKIESHFSVVDNLIKGRKNIFKVDLNGDNIEDTVSVINSVSIDKSTLDTITVLHPWSYYGEGTPPVGLTEGSKISLFVVLSEGNSGSHNYLIYDVNTPSILDADAASELLISKISDLGKAELKYLASHTRGDVIVIPTEAGIDTYIYWSGASFMVYEPAEQP